MIQIDPHPNHRIPQHRRLTIHTRSNRRLHQNPATLRLAHQKIIRPPNIHTQPRHLINRSLRRQSRRQRNRTAP